MTKRTLTIAGCLLCLACAGGPAAAEDIRKVRSIEFRGLDLMSKYDAIRGARLKAVSDGIIVDVDSVETVLSRNSFLSSYDVDEARGRLVITVTEKKPVLVVAVGRGTRTVLYEIGADGAVISRDDVHTVKVPVLIVPDGTAADRTRGLIRLLAGVRGSYPALYRELAGIDAAGSGLRVRLRGRRTEYILRPEPGDFARLNYVAGYCDRGERDPEEINLTGNAVIVR